MPYISQDFQKICANFLGQKNIPNSVLAAASRYHPRLERLLTRDDQKVFDADLNLLANFFQNSQFTNDFSPQPYIRSYKITKQFHHSIRELQFSREAEKYQKSNWKLNQIAEQLEKLKSLKGGANPKMRVEIERAIQRFKIRKLPTQAQRRETAAKFVDELTGTTSEIQQLIKKVNIRKARTQAERRERADELVHDLLATRKQSKNPAVSNPLSNPPSITTQPPDLAV